MPFEISLRYENDKERASMMKLLPISRGRAMKLAYILGDVVETNKKKRGLREFSTKPSRKEFNRFWTETSTISTGVV
jgi:hypothetical protein